MQPVIFLVRVFPLYILIFSNPPIPLATIRTRHPSPLVITYSEAMEDRRAVPVQHDRRCPNHPTSSLDMLPINFLIITVAVVCIIVDPAIREANQRRRRPPAFHVIVSSLCPNTFPVHSKIRRARRWCRFNWRKFVEFRDARSAIFVLAVNCTSNALKRRPMPWLSKPNKPTGRASCQPVQRHRNQPMTILHPMISSVPCANKSIGMP